MLEATDVRWLDDAGAHEQVAERRPRRLVERDGLGPARVITQWLHRRVEQDRPDVDTAPRCVHELGDRSVAVAQANPQPCGAAMEIGVERREWRARGEIASSTVRVERLARLVLLDHPQQRLLDGFHRPRLALAPGAGAAAADGKLALLMARIDNGKIAFVAKRTLHDALVPWLDGANANYCSKSDKEVAISSQLRTADFVAVLPHTRPWDPPTSPLLLKPLAAAAGGSVHQGGEMFADTSDAGYQVIRDWIAGAVVVSANTGGAR